MVALGTDDRRRVVVSIACGGILSIVVSCGERLSDQRSASSQPVRRDSAQVVELASRAAERYAARPFKVYSFLLDTAGTVVALGPLKPLVLGGGVKVRVHRDGSTDVISVQP